MAISKTSLSDTGSVIIIVFVQLRGTTTYLLYISLEIASTVVTWTLKHDFQNSSFILAVLFSFFTATVFHDTYIGKPR